MILDDTRLPVRYWAKVAPEPNTGCWLWTAEASPSGYGRFAHHRVTVRAHRHSYEALVGPIPNGLELDHLCRVRCCVNPAHLEPVTHAENLRRSPSVRGNWATLNRSAGIERSAAVRRAKTHCPHGHLLAGDNVRTTREGARQCKACHRARNREWMRRRARPA